MLCNSTFVNSSVFNGDEDCNATLFNATISNANAVSIIRIIASLLSIVGSSSIIVIVFITGKLNSAEVHPLFVLAVGDFILSCCWLFGGSLWVNNFMNMQLESDNKSQGLCYVLAVATMVMTMVTFLLTAVYAIHAFLHMKEIHRNKGRQPLESSNSWWKHCYTALLYLVCWSLPLILVLPVTETQAGLEQVTNNACWCAIDFYNIRPAVCIDKQSILHTLVYIIATYVGVSFIATTIVIIIFYGSAIYLAWRILKLHQDVKRKIIIKKVMLRALAFIGIFFFCGFPSLVAFFTLLAKGDKFSLQDSGDSVLIYWQSLVAPLQGIFNALVYGWSRKEFRRAITVPVMKVRFRKREELPNDSSGLLNNTTNHLS